MFREKCLVLENKKVAPGHFVLRFRSKRIAKKALPGQFVQILCADSYDPLLPRPFSFLSVRPNEFSILYQVVGKGTRLLASLEKGQELNILGPLGNGFTTDNKKKKTMLLVGGGVGIPPLYHLAESLLPGRNIHVFLGARSKSLLLCENDFKKLGVPLYLTTDDGSKGKKGFITQLLKNYLEANPKTDISIYTCGPTLMLKAVSALAASYEVLCQVSVEVPMACGFGACLGCAIKVKDGLNHRFAIACKEGPVFEAGVILYD